MAQATEQIFAEAVRRHRAGQLSDARTLYQQVLSVSPDHPGALRMLGRLELSEGRSREAADLLSRAIAHDSESVELHANFGAALAGAGRLSQAITEFRWVVQKMPDSPAMHANLGSALLQSGDAAGSIDSFRRAVALKPDDASLLSRLAGALTAAGRLPEAVPVFEQVVALAPADADARLALGDILWRIAEPHRAAEAYRSAISLRPAEALSRLGRALKSQGDIDAAIDAYRQSLQFCPDPDAASALLYTLHFHHDYGPHQLLKEHLNWARKYADPLAAKIKPHPNNADPDRRLRVGYIGQGMNNSGVGRFLLPLLQHHNRLKIEIFCYFSGPHSDAVTEQLRSQSNHWRDISRLGAETVDEMVRSNQIDLLIDLNLHAGSGRRILVFARKPAPVQVTWLGYCGTSGMATMDYRISDGYLDPPGSDESIYVEETIRLSHSFWCYSAPPEAPPIGSVPASSGGAITFGCLNAFDKVTHPVASLWAEILGAVSQSRLLLHSFAGAHRQRFLERMANHGIDPGRIQFVGFLSSEQYFRQYQQIDIALDPFPYPGGTTTCDALWMGVPVVSLPGTTAVSRGGLSILANIGLPELAASSPAQYVQRATELANDLPRLRELRSTMRRRMLNSPLMHAPQFASDLEAAFRGMWQTWCAQRT